MRLHEMFIRTAKRFEKKLAIVDRATNARVSFKDVLLRGLILSSKLKGREEGLIGIMVPTSAGCIYATLAVLMSGRTPVMINYSTGAADNCRDAQRRLAFRTILTSRALLERIKCPVLDGMVCLEDLAKQVSMLDKFKGALRATRSADRIIGGLPKGDDSQDAVILFTSGSEREPKAVPLTHVNIRSNLEAVARVIDFGPNDVLLANLPLFHVFGLTVNMWLPLWQGMTIVTCPNPLEFRSICAAIREEKATVMVGTPAFLTGYLQKSEPGDFASLRLVITGADKCPDHLRRAYWDKHKIILLEGYGTTETSPVISVNTPEHNRPGSVGRALPNVQVRLENYETGEECEVNRIGKVLVKGPSVMRGYFDDFEATSLHMRNGWYDTGDMGFMDDDGYLWHVGRLRRFLKIAGEMVSLVKVEDVLEKLLPQDCTCCVVEVPDALRGARIVAAVTEKVDEKAILDEMAEVLPRISLPKEFVVLPELPKMSSGKLDFRTITDLVRDVVQERERKGKEN
ncbi:MAG: bifunctional acyl-ACP--phospholipid O-acyltransferase/long-chain-fatty-acid--ACP ligase [Acidobacteria bacterium]|nr:MAG: bifunctional acyl-ACP--phospholipid O-acyltransferase/long-chain-fatty-acid--ACP ligase [Acidobacteriota bacterium]